MGKGEIARNEQFLLFPQCFLLNQTIACPFIHIFHILSLFAADSEEPKIGKSGEGLMHLCDSLYQVKHHDVEQYFNMQKNLKTAKRF